MATWVFALGFVWALPNTLLGLVLGLLTFQVPRVHGGALVFDVFDRRGPRGLTWVLAKIPYGYRRHPMERRARLAAGELP